MKILNGIIYADTGKEIGKVGKSAYKNMSVGQLNELRTAYLKAIENYEKEGLPISEISNRLKIGENTVRYLKEIRA